MHVFVLTLSVYISYEKNAACKMEAKLIKGYFGLRCDSWTTVWYFPSSTSQSGLANSKGRYRKSPLLSYWPLALIIVAIGSRKILMLTVRKIIENILEQVWSNAKGRVTTKSEFIVILCTVFYTIKGSISPTFNE